MLTPLKILILDSNPTQALEIERFLKKDGLLFQSKVIDKKVNFIRQLKYFKPDLILSDNCWAEFNAEEAIQLARMIIPEIPFILITDKDSKKYALNSLKIGVDNYIFKNRLTRLPMAIEMALKKFNNTKTLHQTKNKLLDSESRYRSMVERISDGFFSLDNHWNFVYANTHTAEIFKHPVNELIGKNIWKLFPQMINSPFYRAYHKAIKTQKNIFIEDYSSFLNKWIEAHIYPSPEGLVIYFLDVTRERSHKLKIKKTQEEYNNMIERVTDSFMSLDRNFNFNFINKRASEKLHIKKAAIIGKNIWTISPDLFNSPTYDAFKKAMKEQIYISNIDYTPSLGIWHENHIYPSPDGLSVFMSDITDKKKNEIAVKESDELRTLIMSAAPDAIICLDKNNTIIFWNKQAIHLFGWNFDEIKDKKIFEMILPLKYRARFQKELNQYLNTSRKTALKKTIELTAQNKNSKEFPIELFTTYIQPENSNSFFCIFIRDISERKVMENKLIVQEKETALQIADAVIEAQEKERNLIGQELHDNINQILAGTNILLQMAANSTSSNNEKINGWLEKSIINIDSAIKENRKLAHELIIPDIKKESLQELLAMLTKDMLIAAGIQVKIQTDEFKDIHLNEKQKLILYRIAQEQCSNIIKHAKATEVNILLRETDKSIEMSITDNGQGMNAKNKIAGIGLKNIRNRVSIYHGKITIKTEPNKGFTLFVKMPLEI